MTACEESYGRPRYPPKVGVGVCVVALLFLLGGWAPSWVVGSGSGPADTAPGTMRCPRGPGGPGVARRSWDAVPCRAVTVAVVGVMASPWLMPVVQGAPLLAMPAKGLLSLATCGTSSNRKAVLTLT